MVTALGSRTLKWLSDETGISTSMLSDYTRGKMPGADKALAISRALDEDLERLLTGRSRKPQSGDLVPVSEIDLVLGLGATFLDEAPVKETILHFPRSWLRNFTHSPPEKIFFTRGHGDSMTPTILDADIVLVDRGQDTLRMSDKIWAFAYGGMGMIKRLRPMPDGSVKIISDNPNVPEERAYDGELHIIGSVVAITRKT